MKNNVLVIETTKLNVVARTWITTKYGKELKVKEKEDCATTFMPCKTPDEKEHANELEELAENAMEEPGVIKMNDFKKRCNCATVAKRIPKSERKDNTVNKNRLKK